MTRTFLPTLQHDRHDDRKHSCRARDGLRDLQRFDKALKRRRRASSVLVCRSTRRRCRTIQHFGLHYISYSRHYPLTAMESIDWSFRCGGIDKSGEAKATRGTISRERARTLAIHTSILDSGTVSRYTTTACDLGSHTLHLHLLQHHAKCITIMDAMHTCHCVSSRAISTPGYIEEIT
jgi:hypothetical protein